MSSALHSTSHYISDMLEAIATIRRYSQRKTSATDAAEEELVDDAIERKFIELGEAANHLPSTLTDQFSTIP